MMTEANEAIAWLVRNRAGIVADVYSAHGSRGNGASDWMAEDDRDFRRELDAALAALASLPTITQVSQDVEPAAVEAMARARDIAGGCADRVRHLGLRDEAHRLDAVVELCRRALSHAVSQDVPAPAAGVREAALEATLRHIAEGNLGDEPWQANYDLIRDVARAALNPTGAA
jgi:hypothetical protein